MITLLLYSPDSKLQPLLASALHPDFTVTASGRDAITSSEVSRRADILLLDFDSNHNSTAAEYLTLCEQVCKSQIPVVVMTDDLRRSTAAEFLQRGAYDCVRKPPSLLELKAILRRAYDHVRLRREVGYVQESIHIAGRCDELIGYSRAAQLIYDLIRRVANLDAFVLIQGESGTGKELVARAIHNVGDRSQRPFVAVSCGAIPESLIEAELFGHEKGAYTGSVGARIGYLEQAGNGTLFLDEIGELSPNTQVKLLRVLQEREFTRLGSNKPIPLKARVLFATHRDLKQMVAEGTFRRDLYFRVNVLRMNVPALRDRSDDIPLLAQHFLERYALLYDRRVDEIAPDAMDVLVQYDWPGNIRELENVIQSCVILADGNRITRTELPEQIQELSPHMPEDCETDSFDELMRQFKLSLVNKTITECNGNKSLAARKLRVSRAYLHRLARTAV